MAGLFWLGCLVDSDSFRLARAHTASTLSLVRVVAAALVDGGGRSRDILQLGPACLLMKFMAVAGDFWDINRLICRLPARLLHRVIVLMHFITRLIVESCSKERFLLSCQLDAWVWILKENWSVCDPCDLFSGLFKCETITRNICRPRNV